MSDLPVQPVAEPVDDGQVSVDDLRRMLEESRSRNTNLERERDDARSRTRYAERERDEAHGRVVSEAEQRYNAELSAANAQLSAMTDMVSAARTAYRNALEQGDHAAATEAQVTLSRAVSREDQWQGRKAWLESNKPQIAAPAPRQETEYDRLHAQLMPSERDWVASRPRFRDDSAYRDRIVRASAVANMDHERGSPGYFQRIEEILGETRSSPSERSAAASSGHDAEEPPARRQSADLPPTRRAGPGAAPAGRVRVELSAFEREIADGMYGDPNTAVNYIADPGARYEHYAKNRETMLAAGRL
jgi:hypothetical protein